MVRPEGLCQRKVPMTPSGIEPATFRLVARYLNQLHYGVPLYEMCTEFYWGNLLERGYLEEHKRVEG